MCRLLSLAAFLAVMSLQCRAQQPDPVEIVNTAIRNAQRNFVLSQSYTFQFSNDWTYYDKRGTPWRHETKQFDAVFVSGEWYLRLRQRNGRSLEGAEAEQEQRNWERLISGIRAKLPQEQKHNILYSFTLEGQLRLRTQVTREPIPFEDLPRLFELRLLGVENVRNRPAYVIEANPSPAAKAMDNWEDAELHDHVKLWIDIAERFPVRLHLDVLKDRRLVARDSSMELEWEKINDEVWMQTRNLLRLPKLRSQCEGIAAGFRKFDVSTEILAGPVSPAASASQVRNITRENSSSQEEGVIRSIVEKGFEAYQRGDLPGLFSLFSEKSPNLLLGKMDIENHLASRGRSEINDLHIDEVEVVNDTATVRLSFETKATEPGRSRARRFYSFQLVREEGSWKLWEGKSDESEFAAELLDVEPGTERDRLLSERPQLVTEELVDQLVGRGNGLMATGDYTAAVASFQLAHAIAERLGDKAATWKALYGLGHGSLVQGREAEANEYFRQSLALCQELGNESDLSFALDEIGRDFAERSNFRQAMLYYQRSLRLGMPVGKERIASTLDALGDLFAQQGNDEQALEQYRKSLKLFQELESSAAVKLKVTASQAKIADVLTRQGSYKQALEYYEKNLALFEELDAPTSSALILQKIGDNYALRGLLPQALEFYQKSLDLFQEQEHKPGIAGTLDRIASVYSLRGEYDRAIDSGRLALAIAQELEDLSELSRIQATLGQAYLSARQYDQARTTLGAAISSIERLRNQVAGTERDQERFFENRVNPYQAMVELLIQQQDFTQALRFAELAKARVLCDILRSGKEAIHKGMSADEREQERHLNQVLIALNAQLAQERVQGHPSKVLLSGIEAQLEKARLAYEAFETAVYSARPELKVQRGESPPPSLEEICALMTDDSTAFLEYVVTKARSYLFVITADVGHCSHDVREARLSVYPIEIESRDLALRTSSFRAKLATASLDFRGQAQQLYDLLLGPAEKELAGKKTLCVIPSGPLWELPFQALLSTRNRFVLEEHALFYVPSLSVLREIRNKERETYDEEYPLSAEENYRVRMNTPGVLLAVANPDLTTGAGPRTQAEGEDPPYAPLPEQERLARTLGQIYGVENSEILTGSAAREDAVKADAGKYRIIHFATHGILDNDDPLYSGLLLSAGGDKEEDGFLEAREIMQLELHAEVAVLSACDTARGRVHEGEGVMGMSWALFVAGAPTTVVSQWQIDSASTAKLMIAFHRTLKKEMLPGQPPLRKTQAFLSPLVSDRLRASSFLNERRINKARALRQAALMLMADPNYVHPFYWAGFVVVGDGF